MENNDFISRKEFNQLDSRVDDLANRQTRTETRTDHLEQKLDKIDSNTTWILRLIIGAFIMAILTFLLQGGM
ncbi:hemolysin XhlA family protein [Salipaludibacillus sp. CF4.18]|uniref:hemolysin XhlA family protein n=1 Tax=Salipaludibacillus sp. CF4.18 TaxID=3373081 RepID=UPI003EE776A1